MSLKEVSKENLVIARSLKTGGNILNFNIDGGDSLKDSRPSVSKKGAV